MAMEHGVAFSPDGSFFAVCGFQRDKGVEKGTLEVRETRTGRKLREVSLPVWIRPVAWSGDGQSVAVGCGQTDSTGVRGGEVRFYDVSDMRLVRRVKTPYFNPRSLAFSPDGKTLAVGGATFETSDNGRTLLLDVQSGKTGKEFVQQRYVWSLLFTPDGKRLVAGSAERTGEGWGDCGLRVWSLTNGKEMASLPRPKGAAQTRPALAPDGRTLLVGDGPEGDILLYDILSGKLGGTWRGHKREVYAASFSPDGKAVATGSRDLTVRVWDAKTGETITTLKETTGAVHEVMFSPDGKTLLAADTDNKAYAWRVEQEAESRVSEITLRI